MWPSSNTAQLCLPLYLPHSNTAQLWSQAPQAFSNGTDLLRYLPRVWELQPGGWLAVQWALKTPHGPKPV